MWEKGVDKRAIIQIEYGARFGDLEIRNVHRREEQPTEAALIKMSADTVIDRLVLDNISQSAADGVELAFIENEAQVGELIEK